MLAGLLKCCAAPLHMIKARGFRFLKKKKKIKNYSILAPKANEILEVPYGSSVLSAF